MIYVALLRGINVGGNSRVEMARLKATFERLGFTSVKTYINSGNVIFRADRSTNTLVSQIEAAIEQDFGLNVKVLVLDLPAIKKLVSAIPPNWVNDKDMKCDVMFLWREIDRPAILKELPINHDIEDVKYLPGAVVWRIDRSNVTKSRMFKIVGTKLHKQMTVRNPNTVRKVYGLMLEALHPQQ